MLIFVLLIIVLFIMTASSFISDIYVNTEADIHIVEPMRNVQSANANKDKFHLTLLKEIDYYVVSSGITSILKCVILILSYIIFEIINSQIDIAENTCDDNIPYTVAGINIGASYICYISSKTACKILRQRWSFAPPLILSVFLTPLSLFAIAHAPFLTTKIDVLLPRGNLEKNELFPVSEPLLFGSLGGAFVLGFISFIVFIRHYFNSEGRPQGRGDKY